MNKYEEIDKGLAEWASRHSLVWLTDHQGSEVRTFFLRPESKEKVQIWVDPPKNGHVNVHVFQYKLGGKKKNAEDVSCKITDLVKALDEVLNTANKWLSL
ncbi:MAG: hypothetical protein WA624_06325 [Methylocella sp.]